MDRVSATAVLLVGGWRLDGWRGTMSGSDGRCRDYGTFSECLKSVNVNVNQCV